MVVTVSDVIFRRTGIGTGEVPDPGCMETVASLCADELGWSDARRQLEIARVIEELPQISPSSALS
jgi:glycerol-3-phosphate dehydrogenase